MSRDKWRQIRRKIKNNYDFNSDWEDAIILFKKRVETRYFKTVQEIIDLKYCKGEGFPIVTIQCALIETFAAFKYGKIHNSRYQEDQDPNFQYRDSGSLFMKFLLNEEIFENNFYEIKNEKKIENQPFNALDFYTNVRCGLMHETRTKKNWIIKVKSKCQKGIFIEKEKNNKIILRTELQKQLKVWFNKYIEDLKKSSNKELRKFFARKLDHTFELNGNSKKGYDWWEWEKKEKKRCRTICKTTITSIRRLLRLH